MGEKEAWIKRVSTERTSQHRTRHLERTAHNKQIPCKNKET